MRSTPATYPTIRFDFVKCIWIATRRERRPIFLWHKRPPRNDPLFISRQLLELRRIINHIFDSRQSCAKITQSRNRLEQSTRVWMQRICEEFFNSRVFHNSSGVHHADHICVFSNNTKIVCDQHHAHPLLALNFSKQFQNLRLNGDIERSRGLVRKQQFRFARKSHRDHHALTHSARVSMRIIRK